MVLLLPAAEVSAHRSGCHAWHSCPSDTGSYVCGDTGHSNYCGGSSTPVVTYKTVYEDTIIPFQTIYRDSSSLQEGATRILTEGFNGTLRKHYLASYSGGVYQSKYWTRDEVIAQPSNQVIERGTAPAPQVLAESAVNDLDKNYSGWWAAAGAIGLIYGISWIYNRSKQD